MNFPYAKRSEEILAAHRAKYAAMRAALGERKPKPRTLAETIVEGRMVKDWDKDVIALEEAADDQRRATGKLVIVDSQEHMPPDASAAVSHWRSLGRPTEYDETANVLKRLRDEGEKYNALAINDDGKAEKFKEMKNEKKAAQHRKYAQTNRDKAAKFFAEAEQVEAEYRKEHP